MVPVAGSGASVIGLVSVKVPSGYVATSMIRPSNCASRWAESVWMVAILTVKPAVFTVVPVTTICPVTELLRPTAVCDWPPRISLTR